MDLMGIIGFLIMGLIAGFLARWIMPGAQPMSWLQTMIVGVIGSFVGGTIAALIFGGGLELSAAGIIGSIIGALIVLWALGKYGGGRRVAV